MRIVSISFVSLVAAFVAMDDCAAAPTTTPCDKIPAPAIADGTASRANSLALLGSVTQMLSPLGRPVMTSNLETTVAINNRATPALRAQAIIDAQITAQNDNTLADGLGSTMGDIYRKGALYKSEDDGATADCGEISSSIAALILAINETAHVDSSTGKSGYAGLKKKTFPLPPGGIYDVIGKAYGLDPSAKGADPDGNPRPFQTAPLDATSGPSIKTYPGTDFFTLPTNSRIMLTWAKDVPGRTGSNLVGSPSFPSGHTTFGYAAALTLAMMVPERYRALAYRASEYGDSRIVLGAHYAIDVIGGRTLATYDLAQDLAGTKGYARAGDVPLRTALATAAKELRAYLAESLRDKPCSSIAVCAARDPIVRADNASVFTAGTFRSATPGEAYRFRLTYDLPPMRPDTRPPEPVPVEAATLLETRFPYLTPTQRQDVLRSTEGPSGHFLDVSPLDGSPLVAGPAGPQAEVGVYSRLDLYAAAGGYASFADQVVVDQDAASLTDPAVGPFLDFARGDTWTNDICGPGGLTKRGQGTLTLTGTETYKGPTIVGGGTLEVQGSIASATEVQAGGTLAGTGTIGDVAVAHGGTLAPGAVDGSGTLAVSGSLTLGEGAAVTLQAAPKDEGKNEGAVRITGSAKLGGAHLVVKGGAPLLPGARLTILTARGGLRGQFADVTTDAPALKSKLTYTTDAVYLTLEQRNVGDTAPN